MEINPGRDPTGVCSPMQAAGGAFRIRVWQQVPQHARRRLEIPGSRLGSNPAGNCFNGIQGNGLLLLPDCASS
jgi:hypothetical protein